MNQLPELKVSAAKQNMDIICIQEHKYYHRELELRYHDHVWKNSVIATIRGVEMLLSFHALRSINKIVKIQQRLCATFYGNSCTIRSG